MHPISARKLVAELESGERTLNDLIQLAPERPGKPIRAYLRELVWLADDEASAENNFAEGLPDLGAYRIAFEHAPVGIVLSDLTGAILYTNAAFASLIGRPATELSGVFAGDLSVATDREAEIKYGNQLLRGEITHFQVEKRFTHAEGFEVPCLVSLSLVRGDNEQPRFALAVVVDLRAHRQVQELRGRSAKTIAVQRLARGVAHDFNNLLNVIITSVALAVDDATTPDLEDSLSAISEASNLGIRLSRQLHTFSYIGDSPAQLIDLADFVRNHEPFLKRLVVDNQRITLQLDSAAAWLEIAPSDLDQILLNLTMHATQVSKPSGEILITVCLEGAEAVLRVIDRGDGMDEQALAQFLEPGFSERAGGTWLGMSIVSAAMARAGGRLDVQSVPGEGSTITLRFPVVDPLASDALI